MFHGIPHNRPKPRSSSSHASQQRRTMEVNKYGPVSKLNLFGEPTVFIYGPAANKFIFTSEGNTVANEQAKPTRMILGDRTLLEVNGEAHKRVRGAIVPFLKPESLKRYVGKMDEEVKIHLEMHWHGKQQVKELEHRTQLFDKADLIVC